MTSRFSRRLPIRLKAHRSPGSRRQGIFLWLTARGLSPVVTHIERTGPHRGWLRAGPWGSSSRTPRTRRSCHPRSASVPRRSGRGQLSRYLNGWRAYFGFCQTPSVLAELDSWIRRRLRSVLWKQWKRGTRPFAELRARGVSTWRPKPPGAPRPLATGPQPRPELRPAQSLLPVAWPAGPGGSTDCLTSRTAVYGPVRTAV